MREFRFHNSVTLEGWPYGGCAMLWKSTILANVVPLSVNSRRICPVRVCSSNWKLLLVNVNMPYENDSSNTEEYAKLPFVFDDFMITYSNYNVVIGGILSWWKSGLTSHLISFAEVCMCQILLTIRIFTDKGFLQIRASYQVLICKKPLSVKIA